VLPCGKKHYLLTIGDDGIDLFGAAAGAGKAVAITAAAAVIVAALPVVVGFTVVDAFKDKLRRKAFAKKTTDLLE